MSADGPGCGRELPGPGSPTLSSDKEPEASDAEETGLESPHAGFAQGPPDFFLDEASWAEQTRSDLSTARSLRAETASKLLSSTRPTTSGSTSLGLEATLRRRMGTSQCLAKALLARIERVEQLVQKVTTRCLALHKAHQATDDPLRVAHRRLELREHRPPKESLRDHFQTALESERAALLVARQELVQHLQAGQAVRGALEAAKTELVKDIQLKRHQMRLERSCLLFDAFHGKDRACVLPPVTKLTSAADSGDGPGNVTPNGMAVNFVKELLSKTRGLEEHVRRFCVSSDATVQRARRTTEKAIAQTLVSMKKRIVETQDLKKELNKEVSQSGNIISTTQLSLEMLQKEMQRQTDVLRGMDPKRDVPLSSFDQRLPQPILERMRLDAMARNQDQYDKICMNIQFLEEKCQDVMGSIQQLHAAHEVLVDNLESKTRAWNIDVACQKVTLAQEAEAGPPAQAPRRPKRPLAQETLDVLRAKIRAASYTGRSGRELDAIFTKFDKDGSGQLDDDEVRQALRRSLKISPDVISDPQISALCAMLDGDCSGSVSIAEIVAFVGDDSDEMISKRTGKPLLKLAPLSAAADDSPSPGGAAAPADAPAGGASARCAPTPRRQKRVLQLKPKVMEGLRSKIKAASYAGHLGRELEALFGRFDRNGTGRVS